MQLHNGTKIVLFREMSSGLMKQKLFGHSDHRYVWSKKGEACKPKNTIPTMKHRSGRIILRGCFSAGGSGALHKIDGIPRKENYVDILKQYLKTSVRKLKLPSIHKWVFQMDNDPKHTSKLVAKWLKDNKVRVLKWPSQSPDLNPIEYLWAELKKRVRARRPTNLTQLHQLCQEEWAKIHLYLLCGSLLSSYNLSLMPSMPSISHKLSMNLPGTTPKP